MPLPVDLSKISDVVKNDIVTKTVHNKLATKVNSIDTSAFVLKTNYDSDKKRVKKIKFLILLVLSKNRLQC